MTACRFVIADVFTEKRFGGNQLAVFTDARGLDNRAMQDLAREMNYSETTFVLPPESSGDFRVRIFTPGRELPFAGHPIVGTSFVIFSEGLKQFQGPLDRINLETGAGVIAVDVKCSDKLNGYSVMAQPLPRVTTPKVEDVGEIAAALSLEPAAIQRTGLPCQAIYNGLTVLIVPVDSLEAVQRIKVDAGKIENVAQSVNAETVLIFSQQTLGAENSAHCRVFAPGAGVGEDAATGSANGPLGYYLVTHRLAQPDVSGVARIISEQGFEMNRPSLLNIDVQVDTATAEVTGIKVGGGVVIAATGTAIPDQTG